LQKALIFLILVINWSCTSRMFISRENRISEINSPEEKLTRIVNNNISQDKYLIEKGDVLIKDSNSTRRFLFSVKYEKSRKFLISLKSIAGIEGARIYLTKDTLIVNDRLRKRLLYGKPLNIEKITGVPFYLFDMIFGDLIILDEAGGIKMGEVKNRWVLYQNNKMVSIKSLLDEKMNKVSSATLSDQIRKEDILLIYSKFSKKDLHFPGLIEMQDKSRNIELKIRIRKIQIPWEGKIDFVPGAGYKKEELK
jgi:hypothetical protein